MPLAWSAAGPHGPAGNSERLSNAMFAVLAVGAGLWRGIDGNITMNGPLIAVFMVLAAAVFLSWFIWVGIRQPSTFVSYLALWTAAVCITPAIAWAWGLSWSELLSTTAAVGTIVGFVILKSQAIGVANSGKHKPVEKPE